MIAPKANDFILKFDEHSIMDKFKFGVLYQKFGQLTEESIFGNRTHSPAMEEFLEILGQKVELSQHEGYRGGLDTRHGQTGTKICNGQIFLKNREIVTFINFTTFSKINSCYRFTKFFNILKNFAFYFFAHILFAKTHCVLYTIYKTITYICACHSGSEKLK